MKLSGAEGIQDRFDTMSTIKTTAASRNSRTCFLVQMLIARVGYDAWKRDV